jgi:uncharacterized membrane protein
MDTSRIFSLAVALFCALITIAMCMDSDFGRIQVLIGAGLSSFSLFMGLKD